MTERIRRRMTDVIPAGSGRYDRWLNGSYWFGSDYSDPTYGSRQITFDEVHSWPRRKGDSRNDIGGPFHTIKSALKADWDPTYSYTFGSQGVSRRYVGVVRPQLAPSWWKFLYPATPDSDLTFWADSHPTGYLEGLGSKAIAATIPTNASADTAVSVAELFREGFPALIGSGFLKQQSGFFKSLGGEYLNVEFGWKPFISAIQDICTAIDSSEQLLQQLARDSGKNVRRALSFPAEVSTEYLEDNIIPEGPGDTLLIAQRGRSQTTKETHKTWFSGAYTYHYDPADLSEASRIATQARLLLGIKVDPEVLYNLTPWSWLVDWFVNLGPVIHNLSAFGQDGLVLRYGYLMHQHNRIETSTHRGVRLPNGGDFPVGDVSSTFSLESKRRIRATPYGFGLTFSSFSTRQLAILGALGITQFPPMR